MPTVAARITPLEALLDLADDTQHATAIAG
jgi:hypothetical protein